MSTRARTGTRMEYGEMGMRMRVCTPPYMHSVLRSPLVKKVDHGRKVSVGIRRGQCECE